MKRALLLFTACAILLSGICVPAQAQFWKKIFKKENAAPVRKTASRPPVAAKPGPAKKKAPEPVRLAHSITKKRYRIDVLAPVYLNELVTGGKPVYKAHLPDKVLSGLSFYQGIKLASDTLNTYGYNMDIYFHDIADPAQTVETLLKNARLDSADLIIGAVPAPQVAPLAAFARRQAVNFVSVLTPSDGNVRGNLYFNLLQPTLQRHCEVLRNAIARKGRFANILVYHRSSVPVDEQSFKMITKDSSFGYSKVQVNTPIPSEKLRNFLDSNADNIIVMPIVDVAYATQLLEQLEKSFPKFRFEVYGMPSWSSIGLFRKEGALPNIGVTFSAPFYFDPTTSVGRGFSETFTRVFGGKPSDMAYRGYETLYWYAYLLNRYGTVFNDHFGDNGAAPFTRFDMKLATGKEEQPQYYENNHVYLYRYQGGSVSIEQ